MNLLIPIEAFDNFKKVKDFPIADLSPDLIPALKKPDERDEFEPFLRSILTDTSPTLHGPAEIVDPFAFSQNCRAMPCLCRKVAHPSQNWLPIRHHRDIARNINAPLHLLN
ncbi:MAG: hypothetical protein ABR955_01830 [Verrucomicrobiota bacterium]|jgi:hypothetical protein